MKRPVNQRIIGKDYAGAIEVDGVTVYANLKKHLGETNLLRRLRNTVSYHHPEGAELAEAFEEVAEEHFPSLGERPEQESEDRLGLRRAQRVLYVAQRLVVQRKNEKLPHDRKLIHGMARQQQQISFVLRNRTKLTL